MGYEGTIRVYEVSREGDGKTQADEPTLTITTSRSKAWLAGFCSLDRYIVSCHEDGSVCQWDAKSGELYNRIADMHEAQVMDMQFSADRTYFVTASRDKSAKVGAMKKLRGYFVTSLIDTLFVAAHRRRYPRGHQAIHHIDSSEQCSYTTRQAIRAYLLEL